MKGEMAMSIYDAVMEGAGFRRNVEPKAQPQGSAGGRAHAVGWKNGEQVAVPLPQPGLPGYGNAMDRFSNWRGYASPLGGVSAAPWGQAPRFGDDALKPEFRRSARRWGGS
jgi:hypothetical protein